MPANAPPLKEIARAAKARFKSELATAQVVGMGDYPYVTHPVLDGFPFIEPDYVTALSQGCVDMAFPDHKGVEAIDGVITVEAMGIPMAFEFAQEVRKPLFIARKKEYKTPGEIVVKRRTGYSETNLSFNGLQEGKTYWFVDSLFSTGATLKATMLATKLANARIGGSVFLVSKMDEEGAAKLVEMTKAPIFAMLSLAVINAAKETGGEAHGFRVRVSDGFHVRA
jgi:adenine phosphoribosyltransferase